MKEFEFHISPARSSSRPRTGVGTTAPGQAVVALDADRPSVAADFDRLADIWNNTVAPPAHLVAEDPEAPRPKVPDRTFGNDATPPSIAVRALTRTRESNEYRYPLKFGDRPASLTSRGGIQLKLLPITRAMQNRDELALTLAPSLRGVAQLYSFVDARSKCIWRTCESTARHPSSSQRPERRPPS